MHLEVSSCIKLCLSIAFTSYILYTRLNKKQYNGTGVSRTIQDYWFFHWFAEYLGAKLIIDNDNNAGKPLCDPNHKYIFALFPHHVNSVDHCFLLSNGLNFRERVYSGSKRHAAASILFYIPVIRELFLSLGCVDAGKSTFDRMLKKGHSMVVLPGGVMEQVISEYGKEDIFIKNRKGFVKLALDHKCSLVPIYAFGESHLFKVKPWFKNLRVWLAKNLQIGLTINFGRWGIPFLPYNDKGLYLVVGQPIDCEDVLRKHERKDGETDVDIVHEEFTEKLVQLFNKHKDSLGFKESELILH